MNTLTGQTLLITGGNKGLGKQTALELSKQNPSHIWISARSVESGEAAAQEIRAFSPNVGVYVLQLDLTSFESVKAAASRFFSEATRLDILVLNAGIMGGAPATTSEGYEIRFGTNHMGHALLVQLLIPLLKESAATAVMSGVRVVNISSAGWRSAPPERIRFDTLKTTGLELDPVILYCQSKLANLLFSKSLAEKYPWLTSVSLYPGAVKTDLFLPNGAGAKMEGLSKLAGETGKTVEEGVKTHVWACLTKEVINGEYYEPVGLGGTASVLLENEDLREQLWEWTEKELAYHTT